MRLFSIVLAGLPALSAFSVQAADADADADKAGSRLSYAMKIDPAGRQVHMTGTVGGHPREELTRFASFGLRKQVKIGLKVEGDLVNFSYHVLKKVSGKDMEALFRHLVEDPGAVDLATHLVGTGFRLAEKTRAIEIAPETDAEKKLFKAILSE